MIIAPSTARTLLAGAVLFFMSLTASLPAVAGEADERWLTRVDDAVEAAADGDRLILVDLYADWCGWCKVLEREVFTAPPFEEYTKDFVYLRVDVEDGGEGSALQARYNASSLPTTLVIDHNMVRVAKVPGYSPVDAFLQQLDHEIQGYNRLVDFAEKALVSDNTEAITRIATDLHKRGDGDHSAPLYARLLEIDPDPKRIGWLHYLQADALRLAKHLDKSRVALDEARRWVDKEGAANLAEELDLLVFRLAQDEGDCDAAKTSLKHFLEIHPRSRHRGSAEATLVGLNQGSDPLCA